MLFKKEPPAGIHHRASEKQKEETAMKKWMSDLEISKKLTVGFLFITCLGVIISGVGIFGLFMLGKNQKQTYQECTLGIKISEQMVVDLISARMYIRDVYIYYENPNKPIYYDKIAADFAALDKLLVDYQATVSDAQDQANVDAAKAAYAIYRDSVNKMIETSKAFSPSSDVLQMIVDASDSAQNATKAFQDIADYNANLAEKRLASDSATTTIEIIILAAVTVIAIVLALVLSRLISNLIAPQVAKFAAFAQLMAAGDMDILKVSDPKDREWAQRKDEIGTLAKSYDQVIESTNLLTAQVQAIAAGDLTTAVTVRSEDDILGKAVEELVGKFHDLTTSIISAADQVSSGAAMVSTSSMSLSEGASTQASSVQQLSASIQEIAAQTTANAQNAREADGLAKNAKTDAEKGNTQMSEMLKAMDDINISSTSINKIIKVIDDIAFQTNILALNAAVEAARAGQYGKGFAVVAEEVRNLAAKSANAAKETTNLIEGSIKNVEMGTNIANNTAGALGEIVKKVTKAADLIGSIAKASEEQAAGIEQINHGVLQVSHVVQNTAAISEESAAASEELSSQAAYLKEQTGYFTVKSYKTAMPPRQTAEPKLPQQEIPQKALPKAKISLSEDDFGKY